MLETVNVFARRPRFSADDRPFFSSRLPKIPRALPVVFISLHLAFAAEKEPEQLTNMSLQRAAQIAFLHNWDLLAAKSDVDIAAAQRIVSKEFPNPTLSLSTLKINVGDHVSSTTAGNGFWDRSYDSIAAVNQLFEIGGKRGARQASAAAGLAGAEARFAEARRTLELGVTQAYIAVLVAEAKGRVLRESAVLLRKEAEIAVARRHAGEISIADESQIEIAADRLFLDADDAEAAARNSRIALELLLGEKQAGGKVEPAEDLPDLAGRFARDTNASPEVLVERPDVLAAERTRDKAAADLRLQRAMRVPDPTVLAQYEHEPPGQPNTIGLGVTLPLPLWNRNRGNIYAAEATLRQTEVQLEKIRAQAAADIATTRTTFISAANRWMHYRDELAPRSQKIRDTVSFAYEKGNASLLDLLAAQRNDNDIRIGAAQAAADTASAAAAFRAARAQQVIPGLEKQSP